MTVWDFVLGMLVWTVVGVSSWRVAVVVGVRFELNDAAGRVDRGAIEIDGVERTSPVVESAGLTAARLSGSAEDDWRTQPGGGVGFKF